MTTVARLTPDDVVRGLRRTILMPGRCEEGSVSPEYENTLAYGGEDAASHWKYAGNGVEVLEYWRCLIRIHFRHTIERRGAANEPDWRRRWRNSA